MMTTMMRGGSRAADRLLRHPSPRPPAHPPLLSPQLLRARRPMQPMVTDHCLIWLTIYTLRAPPPKRRRRRRRHLWRQRSGRRISRSPTRARAPSWRLWRQEVSLRLHPTCSSCATRRIFLRAPCRRSRGFAPTKPSSLSPPRRAPTSPTSGRCSVRCSPLSPPGTLDMSSPQVESTGCTQRLCLRLVVH